MQPDPNVEVLSPEFQTSMLFSFLLRKDREITGPRIEAVKNALAKGADVNACRYGSTPLMVAAERGYVDIVQLLLEKGADANAIDSRGDTPLMQAAFAARVDIVRLLLEHGADPEMKDRDGKMAHELAEMAAEFLFLEGAHETARLLKETLETRFHQKRQERDHQMALQRQAALKRGKSRIVLKF